MSDIALKELIDKDDIDSGEETTASVESIADKSDISDEEASKLLQDQDLEEKYGDSGLRTFAESAASGASFGISDQILTKTGLVSEEDLRERRKRNSGAAIAGEISGVVAPALLSGGSSLLGAGVKGAAKAGLAAEKVTASVLKKILKESGKKSIVKDVLRKGITKGSGSAVEGSFYGTGKLISEEALGNADFNAENLISHAGTSAAFGGALGGVFGTVSAAVPVIKGNKVTGWVTKKLKGSINPEKNAAQLQGMSPAAVYKHANREPLIYKNTPKVIKEVIKDEGLKTIVTNNSLFQAMNRKVKSTGESISKSLDKATKILTKKGAMPTRQKMAQRIVDKLDELKVKYTDAEGVALKLSRPEINLINKTIKSFKKDLTSSKNITPKELNALKQKYQKLAKYDHRSTVPVKEDINRKIAQALREETLEVAKRAGGDIGAKLQKDLLDYGTAISFTENLGLHIAKQSEKDFYGVKDLFLGGMFGEIGMGVAAINKFAKSDLKKRLTILTSIEKSNQVVTKKISSGVSKFLKNIKKPIIPASTRVIMTSKLSRKEQDGEFKTKPKNKQEAFKNISKNVQELASNPDKLNDILTLGNVADAAPETANMSALTVGNSIQFLASKLPKDGRIVGAFTRAYEPSTLEMAKFEKYLEAVENPLSILDDLQSGTISRESVEAIKAVYPNLYTRIQENVLNKVSEDPEAVTYEKRLNLGILLEIPTDAALNPMNIKALQNHFKEAEQSQSGGAIAPNQPISAGSAAKLNMAESTASEVTKVSNRRDLE